MQTDEKAPKELYTAPTCVELAWNGKVEGGSTFSTTLQLLAAGGGTSTPPPPNLVLSALQGKVNAENSSKGAYRTSLCLDGRMTPAVTGEEKIAAKPRAQKVKSLFVDVERKRDCAAFRTEALLDSSVPYIPQANNVIENPDIEINHALSNIDINHALKAQQWPLLERNITNGGSMQTTDAEKITPGPVSKRRDLVCSLTNP